MPIAIRVHKVGGPLALVAENVNLEEPGEGEVRVRHRAIAVNFIDVYHRSGLYPLPLPTGLGVEGVGQVETVGKGVTSVKPGDRVAYLAGPGSYADFRNVSADKMVRLPDSVSDESAAAGMMKGLTVHMLVRRCHAVKPGETVLWHAAAGGVGQIALQWLKSIGAKVIGTVGSEDKAALVKQMGCDHVIVYSREDVAKRVKEITDGEGVSVVYDSVGKATFEASLDSLKPFGQLVSFGNASGAIPPFDILMLSKKGSLSVTRPTVFQHVAKRSDFEAAAGEVIEMIGSGRIKASVGGRWQLREAAEAHRALEGRSTSGSLILVP